MHPKTPTIRSFFSLLFFLIALKYSNLFQILFSAFSLIEQVFIKIILASSILSDYLYPAFYNIPLIISESDSFI